MRVVSTLPFYYTRHYLFSFFLLLFCSFRYQVANGMRVLYYFYTDRD